MKTNYQLLLDEQLKKLYGRKKLLLHSCCAPCSTYVLEYLKEYFDITLLYYNPNIYPPDEFYIREKEQKRLCEALGIGEVFIGYDENEFYKAVRGLEKEPEGGARCLECFRLRLFKTAEYAKNNGFDFFTTTLSISPHKNAEVLNSVCKEASEKFGVPNLWADFKKRGGYKRSCELSEEYGIYRQNYCGCIFSIKGEKQNDYL